MKTQILPILFILIFFLSCYKEDPPQLEILFVDINQTHLQNVKVELKADNAGTTRELSVDTILYSNEDGYIEYETKFDCYLDFDAYYYYDSNKYYFIDTIIHMQVNNKLQDTLIFNEDNYFD